MMVELAINEFPQVLSLYAASEGRFPLISAVIQGKQRGQIFADKREAPRFALVVSDFGFTLAFGAFDSQAVKEVFEVLGHASLLKPRYLLWYHPPAAWQHLLDRLVPVRVRRRTRIRLNFLEDRALWLGQPVILPPGYSCEPLSRELIPRIEKFGVQIGSRFWSSVDDFLSRGFGACVIGDGEVRSLCYAAVVIDGLAEIDVATEQSFRGHGLATLATQCFIRECILRGVLPTWDCFDYNAGSLKLALKLGFEKALTYPFYSFELPLECDSLLSVSSTRTA